MTRPALQEKQNNKYSLNHIWFYTIKTQFSVLEITVLENDILTLTKHRLKITLITRPKFMNLVALVSLSYAHVKDEHILL